MVCATTLNEMTLGKITLKLKINVFPRILYLIKNAKPDVAETYRDTYVNIYGIIKDQDLN